jgi:hypothetical protein
MSQTNHPNGPPEFSASTNELITYRVQVGHTATTVQGRSREEAIREARRKLCQEMPRMWDMIHKLEDSRFEVVAVK